MPVQQQFSLSHSGGEDIYLFTLRNSVGTIVTITNYGAIITSFSIQNKDGTRNDIVLGFERPAEYFKKAYLEQYPWFGCAIGRYANRIKDAGFDLDGKKYHLSKNRGNDQLHGGEGGLDRKTWQLQSLGEEPFPFLELRCLSPDGEEGFPGNLDILLRFELNDDNELNYTYTATTDQATPVNLTHHSYFNLHNGDGSIEEQEIKIHASTMLEQERDLIPTGKEIPVAGTPYDFREFRAIGEGLSEVNEYDRSFVAEKKSTRLVAEARSARSGVHLQVFSTEPVVHFYSGKWIPEVKGKNDTHYGPFSGFCLETHTHPNAVNIPHFPNTILRPGETYFQETIYKII